MKGTLDGGFAVILATLSVLPVQPLMASEDGPGLVEEMIITGYRDDRRSRD